MTVLLVAGTTETASIEGISAAGADPDAMLHTPAADLEIVAYGDLVWAPFVPVSPSGCPTPAVVTRAVRDLLGFDVIMVDAGLACETGAPTVAIGDTPGVDIRRGEAVPKAPEIVNRAREFGATLPVEELVIGETIPGGTTTALAVLTALGEPATVSSSLPENPLALKREVVAEALAAAGLESGDAAGNPVAAVQYVGDPVLAAVVGLVMGATAAGTDVILAGGTQLAAAAALARHAGVDAHLELATTPFIATDGSTDVDALAAALDLDLRVTDPGFGRRDHPATAAYIAGEAKEGVGMGGALALADRAGVPMTAVRDQLVAMYDRLRADSPTPQP